MDAKAIRNDKDLTVALVRLEQLWDAPPGSKEGHELELLAAAIEKYEDQHYPMPATDPIAAAEFLRDQQSLPSH